MTEVIRVVGAVFQRENQFLAFRRRKGKSLEGYWEFPGGKIEAGESAIQALEREIAEELEVDIEAGELVSTSTYEYPFATVELSVFECTASSFDFVLRDHDQTRWVTESDALKLQWAPADIPAVKTLLSGRG